MSTRRPVPLLSVGTLALALALGPSLAQTAAPGATEPATPAPATPSPSPAPASPTAPAPAPVTPPPASPETRADRPTLLPSPGDPSDVDDVTLAPKPAAILSGQSTWDDGFAQIMGSFRRLEEELRRAGIAPAGRPLAVFLETDDMGFRYEAMIPITEAPDGRGQIPPEVRFGKTPEGRVLRFVHKAPYDDIDSTYETITAYLDAKGIEPRDLFVEEYATDAKDPDDPNLEINVFVFPK